MQLFTSHSTQFAVWFTYIDSVNREILWFIITQKSIWLIELMMLTDEAQVRLMWIINNFTSLKSLLMLP